MWLHIFLICIIIFLTFLIFRKRKLQYTCFLLTLEGSTKRQQKFLSSFNDAAPLEVVYGTNTKQIENAEKYKHIIDPLYYKEALRLNYKKDAVREDVTFFNLGAIGCYLGHMEIMKQAFDKNIKYALVFEDNVIIKRNELFNQVQSVIDVMGDDFEMCFFHCLSRYPVSYEKGLEKVKWISSTKCYLIHVDNMRKYYNYYFPIDNHVDNKTDDIIAQGARVYYKDLRRLIKIDRSDSSTIGHSSHNNKSFFSKQHPELTTAVLKRGY